MSFEFTGYQTRSTRFQEELEAPMEDVLGATAAQAISELPIPSIKRFYELSEAEQSAERIDAVAARQRLKDAGLDGRLKIPDSGIAAPALDILMSRKREEIQRQEILSRAPAGLGTGAAQLGMAFAASALDPLNVGLAFVPVVGQARYLRYLAGARGVLGRAGIRAGVGAVEGAAGAAIIEPLVYAAKTQEQADYDMQDSLLNVAFGTVFGGGLHVVGGALADAARGLGAKPVLEPGSVAAKVDAMSVADREIALRTAESQAMQGREVNVEAVIPRMTNEERVIQAQVMEILAAREIELSRVTESRDALAIRMSGDTKLAAEDLQRAITERDLIAREVSALPDGSPERPMLIERQARAQQVVDSRRGAVERGNRTRAAEIDLEQLRYARESAKTIDELVDALPTSQQTGFKRRIETGRISGDVRSKGAKLTSPEEPVAKTIGEAREIAQRQATAEADISSDVRASEAAEAQITEAPKAADDIAEQEAELADQLADLENTARIAGIDLKEEISSLNDYMLRANEYGKAAMAAALCGLGH